VRIPIWTMGAAEAHRTALRTSRRTSVGDMATSTADLCEEPLKCVIFYTLHISSQRPVYLFSECASPGRGENEFLSNLPQYETRSSFNFSYSFARLNFDQDKLAREHSGCFFLYLFVCQTASQGVTRHVLCKYESVWSVLELSTILDRRKLLQISNMRL
jgi:hypothetical protein